MESLKWFEGENYNKLTDLEEFWGKFQHIQSQRQQLWLRNVKDLAESVLLYFMASHSLWCLCVDFLVCSILHLLALICLICLFGAGIVKGGKRPRIWHLLEIVRLGEIAFLGAITDLEEQSSTWRALPPIEGSLKLKSGAFLSPTTRALSIGRGCSEDLTGSSWRASRGNLLDGQGDLRGS